MFCLSTLVEDIGEDDDDGDDAEEEGGGEKEKEEEKKSDKVESNNLIIEQVNDCYFSDDVGINIDNVVILPGEYEEADRIWQKRQNRYFKPIKKRRQNIKLLKALVNKNKITQINDFSLNRAQYYSTVNPDTPAYMNPNSNVSSTSSLSLTYPTKPHRAALFAHWLLLTYGESFLRGWTKYPRITSTSSYRRFGCHSLFLFPRKVNEVLECEICSRSNQSDNQSNNNCQITDPKDIDDSASSPFLSDFHSFDHCSSSNCHNLLPIRSVIDVAGGRGHLSFLLSHIYSISSTIIDPRPSDMNRWRLQWEERWKKSNQKSINNTTVVCDTLSTISPSSPAPALPPDNQKISVSHDSYLNFDPMKLVSHYQCYFPKSYIPTKSELSQMRNRPNPAAANLPSLLLPLPTLEQQHQQVKYDVKESQDLYHFRDADIKNLSSSSNFGSEESRADLLTTSTFPHPFLYKERNQLSRSSPTNNLDPHIAHPNRISPLNPPQDQAGNDNVDLNLHSSRHISPSLYQFDFPVCPDLSSVDTDHYQHLLSTLSNCSLLVGLHPDSSAEFIIDFALANNKLFAIVPCCVFSKTWPNRKIRIKKGQSETKPLNYTCIDDSNSNGCEEKVEEYEERAVVSYEDFLVYLESKDSRIKRTTLPFQGKNVILYMDILREEEKV